MKVFILILLAAVFLMDIFLSCIFFNNIKNSDDKQEIQGNAIIITVLVSNMFSLVYLLCNSHII